MISHRHKCIFVHIPKTGGMSIEKAFMDSLNLKFYKGECPPLILSYNQNPKVGPVSLAHLSPQEYLDYSYISQDLFDAYFKFAIVRNPYDRIVSVYRHFRYHRVISFSKFIQYEFPKLKESRYYFIKPQVEYLYTLGNRLMVDHVGRFEDISSEFKNIEEKLQHKLSELDHINNSRASYNVYSRWNIRYIAAYLKENPRLFVHLNIKNKTAYKTLDHFDENTLSFVNDFYGEDFERLGYQKLDSL